MTRNHAQKEEVYQTIVQPKAQTIPYLTGFFAPAPMTWVKEKGAEGFYTEYASYMFYDVFKWNDLCGVTLLSDS